MTYLAGQNGAVMNLDLKMDDTPYTETKMAENIPPNDFNHYKPVISEEWILSALQKDQADSIALFLEARDGRLPCINPKRLFDEIKRNIPSHENIETLKLTRQGKLLIITQSIETAFQFAKISDIGNIPVKPCLGRDSISTRFLLKDIPTDISCDEIAAGLQEIGILTFEVRRFVRKIDSTETPTSTVLITKIGTYLPENIKLWYQRHRLSVFFDRPRQCLKCWDYKHTAKSCNNDSLCRNCGSSHTGNCTSESKCISCKEPHAADDKRCTRYKEEVKILEMKSNLHISMSEARRRFQVQTTSTSYAGAAANTTDIPPSSTTYITKTDLKTSFQDLGVFLATTIQNAMESCFEKLCKYINEEISVPMVQCVQKISEQTVGDVTSFIQALTQQLMADTPSNSSPSRKVSRSHETSEVKTPSSSSLINNSPSNSIQIQSSPANLQLHTIMHGVNPNIDVRNKPTAGNKT